MTAGLKFSTKKLHSGHVVPHVESADTHCKINRHDISIHIGGSFVSDIASLFKVFFVGTVADQIETILNDALKKSLPNYVNSLIEKTDGVAPFFIPDWAIDFQTPKSAIVTKTALELGIKGLFHDRTIGEEEPLVAIPDMPYNLNPKKDELQLFISTWTIDSFWQSLIEVSNLQAWFYSSDAFPMTTTSLNVLLPGIEKHYGANLHVDVHW